MFQSIGELESWHQEVEPWKYAEDDDASSRNGILLGEIPVRDYLHVLHVGCGRGALTLELPGKKVLGVDVSPNAITQAKQFENQRISFEQGTLFDLRFKVSEKFDLIILSGVLYPEVIGQAHRLAEVEIDRLLVENGILLSAHAYRLYHARFPYLMLKNITYDFRGHTQLLEVYVK